MRNIKGRPSICLFLCALILCLVFSFSCGGKGWEARESRRLEPTKTVQVTTSEEGGGSRPEIIHLDGMLYVFYRDNRVTRDSFFRGKGL